MRLVSRQVNQFDVAAHRFIERIKPNHIGQVCQALCNSLHRIDVVILQVITGILAVNLCTRCQVIASEKQRKHRRRAELVKVRQPHHPLIIVRHLLGDGRSGGIQLGDVHANRFQRPARCATTARPAAPHILMRVNEDLNPVVIRFGDHRVQVVQVVFVVLVWPLVLYRLPRHLEAQKRHAPRL